MGNLQIEKVSSFYRSTLRWNFRIFNRLGEARHEIDVNPSVAPVFDPGNAH